MAVGACAASPAVSAAAATDMRVLVKLVQPSQDGTAIAVEAAQAAGVPVRYIASAGASWHALVLSCAGAAQCDAAVERLRTASGIYAAVERDGRMQRM